MFFETEYIGKSHIATHFCRCDGCRRLTMLSSYSTTRFAKMLNIPLIPIGKFRMIDECPQCGSRGITSARKHEKERKRNLALMMEGFASEADNPHNCAHALHTLMTYDMESWFHDVQKSYGLRFETHMQIQYLIAQGLSRFGKYKEAMTYCRKAIVLGAGKQAEELLAYCQTLLEATEGLSDLEALKVKPESCLRAYTPLISMAAAASIALVTIGISSLQNYKAWIVNGSLQKYKFALDDQAYDLEPGATKQITLRLGEHELKVDGMPSCQFTYSIPIIKQLLDKHLLVINPDAMALLAVKSTSKSTTESGTLYSSDGQIRIFPGIGNPQHGIRRIAVDSELTDSISLYRPQNHMAMVELMKRLGKEEASVNYARRALLMNPGSEESVELLKVAFQRSNDEATLAFLQKGLSIYPSLIPWHLYYQNYMKMNHPEHALDHEYTLRCKQHSEEPASYYLLAHVVHDRQTAYQFYEYSDRNKGMNGMGYFAVAQDLYTRAQFKEALPYCQKALEVTPGSGTFRNLKENILLALRDYDSLLKNTLKSSASPEPADIAMRKILYLTCAGYHQEASMEIAKLGEKRTLDLLRLNAVRFYAVGNINDYLDCMADMGNPHTDMERFLHSNKIVEADELISKKEDHPYWEHLVLYCAAMSQNLQQIAACNLEKAIAETGPDSSSSYLIKKMLAGELEVTVESIRELEIGAQEKAILCVALSYRFPDMYPQLNELATMYNFTPSYPQLLVKRWIREHALVEKTPTATSRTQTVALDL